MRQVVKNYIRKENIDSPNSSTINFAIVDFIPFLNYITKVLSIFDNKQYQYHILKVINDKETKTKRLNIYDFDNRKWQMLVSKNENNLSYKQSLDYILHQDGEKTIILDSRKI